MIYVIQSKMARKRNYKREYALYYGNKDQLNLKHFLRRKEKSARNMLRQKLQKRGLVSRFDGMDIDHKDHNPLNSNIKNIRIVHRSLNRAKNHD